MVSIYPCVIVTYLYCTMVTDTALSQQDIVYSLRSSIKVDSGELGSAAVVSKLQPLGTCVCVLAGGSVRAV